MKKVWNMLAAMCLTAAISSGMYGVYAWAETETETASGTGQVILEDRADLLSDQEEAGLLEQAQQMAEDSGFAFMLITTDDAEGKDAMTYAEDYYMAHETTLDGAVYLIDMDNREIYLATSGEMRFYLNDDRWNAILDDMYDCVTEEDYEGAFTVALSDTAEYLSDGVEAGTYTVDENTGEREYYQGYVEPKAVTAGEAVLALLISIVCGGAVLGIVLGKYRLHFKPAAYDYRDKDNYSLKLKKERDVFLHETVVTRQIHHDNDSSGDGPSSTVHSGSDGNSFGGGGRSF